MKNKNNLIYAGLALLAILIIGVQTEMFAAFPSSTTTVPTPPEGVTVYDCSVDVDCVAEQCCQSQTCINEVYRESCEGIYCTAEVVPHTIGVEGSCVCLAGKCRAYFEDEHNSTNPLLDWETYLLLEEENLSISELVVQLNSMSVSVDELTVLVEGQSLTLEEQGVLISSLDLEVVEQAELISGLTSSNVEQGVIIEGMSVSLGEQADLITGLNLTVVEQVEVIESLNLDVAEQADMISLITSDNEEMAVLIDELSLSVEDKSAIINELNLEIEGDAIVISHLQNTLDEKYDIINGLGYPSFEESRLIADLEQQVSVLESENDRLKDSSGATSPLMFLLVMGAISFVAFTLVKGKGGKKR